MFKFNRLVLTVMLVGVAGVAWGGARKIPTLVVEQFAQACDGTIVELNVNPDADGMAILNYVAGTSRTNVQIIVTRFTGAPLDRFIVRLTPGDGFALGTFLVDGQGNGHFHGTVLGNFEDSSVELWQQVAPPGCPAVLIASGG